MFLILEDTIEYNAVWDKVYEKLNFKPSSEYRGHSLNVSLPFEILAPYSIYAIERMNKNQIDLLDELIRVCLEKSTLDGRNWYALDWHHSAFIFHPKNVQEQKSIWIEDSKYQGGGYCAYFPSFYPDGDYYFYR